MTFGSLRRCHGKSARVAERVLAADDGVKRLPRLFTDAQLYRAFAATVEARHLGPRGQDAHVCGVMNWTLRTLAMARAEMRAYGFVKSRVGLPRIWVGPIPSGLE